MSKFVPRWLAKYEEGKLAIQDQQGFRSYLSSLTGDLEVIVTQWQKRRSLKQNDYFHAYVRLICDEEGDTEVEQMKAFLKDECGERVEVTRFGKQKTVPKSTALYTKKEMQDFITRIEILTGIPAPDPQKVKVLGDN